METTVLSQGSKIVTRSGRIYLAVMLIGLPLVVHDGFFDITEAKTVWFVVFTAIYLVARLVCAIQFSEPGRPPAWPKKPWEIAALALCFIALLASIGSGQFRVSYLGETGRWQGCGMIWLYAAVYFAFSGSELRDGDVLYPLGLGLLLSGALAIANHMGWDVFGLEERLVPFDQGRYISTLGNINFAGAYISLALPVLAGYLLYTEKWQERIALGLTCAVGLWAALAVRSDCVILGLGAAVLVMPFLLRRRPKALRRCWLLWPAAVILGQIYRIAAALRGAELSALTWLLLSPTATALIGGVGAGLYGISRQRGTAGLVRAYGRLLLICAALGIGGLVLVNTVLSGVELGRWGEWLRFSDSWGTDRVKIWKYCLGIYGRAPLWEKLLGGGCGVLASVDVSMRIFPDAILDAAHNEYLQILLNWGLLGLAAYLWWIIAGVRDALRRGGMLSLALGAGLIGYGAQALVNIAQAPGIMLFFVLLAVQRAVVSRENP